MGNLDRLRTAAEQVSGAAVEIEQMIGELSCQEQAHAVAILTSASVAIHDCFLALLKVECARADKAAEGVGDARA